MIVAIAGFTLASMPDMIAGRLGFASYLVIVVICAVALVAIVRPPRPR